jgi:arginine/lysine/ornithine decarboxylase
MAMFLAACDSGDSLIVSRSSHKSIMMGIIMSGVVWPIWIQPKIDRKLDLFFNSTYDHIKDALDRYPEVKAL